MLIAGMLCICAAVILAVLGLRSLTRPAVTSTAGLVMRSVAPPQLAASTMLAVAGVVALAAPQATALTVVCVCIVGALGTVAAGSYQTARFALHHEESAGQCAGSCAACTLSCH
ncbi:hypothetical protein A5658_01575 [Mycobacterium sp. 1245111.1]|uniref:hypothetical protein n=1 Tax=Mycobacterium sp. 1245111.1 TaxID=1834073 RepID=UPI0008023A6E|nr:hypothetical protein [Mycobacterium sp. 1245111.1]OBK34122.1 hypothetical protein A5658_01575 [Mycobacterium sp. 1245111.1]